MRRLIDDLFRSGFVAIVAVGALFLLLPMLMVIVISFDARDYLGRFPPPALSTQWFESFFSDRYFLVGLKTSAILALSTAFISATVGSLAALALDRYRFPGHDALSVFFLSPLVVPNIVLGFALLMFISAAGVHDGFWRLLVGHVILTVPYTIRTTLAGLSGIRANLTEAAMSLGANERQAFFDVTFPLARTGILAGWMFAFSLSWDEVTLSLFLVDPFSYTLPTALFSTMRDAFNLTVAAASVVMMAVSAVAIIVLDRLVGLDRVIGSGVHRA